VRAQLARAVYPASVLPNALVVLDRDHPGFRDLEYRRRRDAIARLALDHRIGEAVPEVAYTEEEHEVWRVVQDHLAPLHARYACRAYRDAAAKLSLDRERVPQLAALNQELRSKTDDGHESFSMLPVAGLVTPKLFMDHLDDRIFLSTQYMRHHSRPLYTPEPDVIHELVGHAPTFLDPGFVRLSRAFGRGSRQAEGQRVDHLIRLYWYTLEFGLVMEDGELRVAGAGLLSSFGELERFEAQARIVPFEIERIIEAPFDPTGYQDTLFLAPSFASLVDDVCAWVLSSAS
jgi:phenylalanine-4-hydroxylase